MQRSILEGIYVLAKFFLSKSPQGEPSFISRTLGKISILDRDSTGKIKEGELWVCKILKEIKPGQNAGAFILKPVKHVPDGKDLRKIMPGFYEVEPVNAGKAALVMPTIDPDGYWIMSMNTRQIFRKKYYAAVVPIRFNEEAPTE